MLLMFKEVTMNKYFLKYKFSYLLAMLSVVSIAQNTNTHAQKTPAENLMEFGNFFIEMESNIKMFLNKKDSRSYLKHINSIDKTIDKYQLAVRSKLQSDLDKEVNRIVQEFKEPFFLTQTVLKKYLGKTAKRYAHELIRDLRPILGANPLVQIFSNLQKKLTTLLKKAIAQNDAQLANVTQRFINYIDQQKAAWNGMSQIELFSALCRRMDKR